MSLSRKSAVVAVAVAALITTSYASAAAPDPTTAQPKTNACFHTNQVQSFAPRGMDGVNLRAHGDVYQVDFWTPCPGIADADNISMHTTSGSGFVCTALDAEIVAASHFTGRERCRVRTLRKLTLDEAKALPKSEQP